MREYVGSSLLESLSNACHPYFGCLDLGLRLFTTQNTIPDRLGSFFPDNADLIQYYSVKQPLSFSVWTPCCQSWSMVRLFPLSPPAAAVVEWHSPQSSSPYLCLYHLGQLSCCIGEIDVLTSLHLKTYSHCRIDVASGHGNPNFTSYSLKSD